MTPETRDQIGRARQALDRAKIILAAGVAEDAGRGAYIAALHATYEYKDFADYGTGPRTGVSLDEAGAAIEKAERFVDYIEQLLA